MRILISRSLVGPGAYFDFFRFPSKHSGEAHLLIWAGGALPSEVYEDRRSSEPIAILNQLKKARRKFAGRPVDVVILSIHPTLLRHPGAPQLFCEHITKEVIPNLPVPVSPSNLLLVGGSFGAFLLTHLAFYLTAERREPGVPKVRALATIAGVGLWAAVSSYPNLFWGGILGSFPIRCYANQKDFAAVFATELAEELKLRGLSIKLSQLPGNHNFADYIKNGSVVEAFKFVMKAGIYDPIPF